MATTDITWFTRNSPEKALGSNDIKAGGWPSIPTAQAGERIYVAEYADTTIHINGSFSGSATAAMRGSCKDLPDPDTAGDWFTLHAAHDGSELSGLDANTGAVLLENPLWLSPLVTGGDGSTALNFDITLKKGT